MLNTDFLKGYKTYIVGALLVLYAVCQWLGIDIPAVPQPGDPGSLTTGGILMLLLRKVTDSPPAPLSGLLGKGSGV